MPTKPDQASITATLRGTRRTFGARIANRPPRASSHALVSVEKYAVAGEIWVACADHRSDMRVTASRTPASRTRDLRHMVADASMINAGHTT